jgi:hypothetical protein
MLASILESFYFPAVVGCKYTLDKNNLIIDYDANNSKIAVDSVQCSVVILWEGLGEVIYILN